MSDHLVITKSEDSDGHIHCHGTDNVNIIKELIDHVIKDYGLENKYVERKSDLDLKEVVFHNRQRIGDMLMFTAGVRDFKKAYPNVRVNVISVAAHIWDYNPNIDRTLQPTEQNTIKIGPGKITNASNRLDWHFANAFRVSIEDNLKIHIPQGPPKPDIWLTEEEYNAPRITDKPYWIIVIGGEKGWGCKMYPFERWQKFVKQNPDTLFYQLGTNIHYIIFANMNADWQRYVFGFHFVHYRQIGALPSEYFINVIPDLHKIGIDSFFKKHLREVIPAIHQYGHKPIDILFTINYFNAVHIFEVFFV